MNMPVQKRETRSDQTPAWMWFLLAVLSIVFVVDGAVRIGAPFGDSHDGRNGATWALGSRTLRELGWVESKGGALMGERGSVYAHHPPLIIFETAAADSIGGERPWVTKAPAYLSSVLAIFLLFVLLRTLGIRAGPSLATTIAVTGTAMFLVYGAVLNMEAISFPLGIGVLIVWERVRRNERIPAGLVFGVPFLAALSSWQGVFLAAGVSVLVGWGLLNGGRPARRRYVWLLIAGASAGILLSALWLLFANGWSVRPLVDQTAFRVTGGTFTFSGLLHRNWRWLRETFPTWVPLILIPVAVAALVERRTREVTLLSGTMVLIFALVLGNGSFIHDYWNYWLLLPLAVGMAATADLLLDGRRIPTVVLIGLAVVSLAVAVRQVSPAERRILQGVEAGAVVRAADYPANQRFAWTVGLLSRPLWIDYYARLPSRHLDHDGALASPSALHLDDIVFVTEREPGTQGDLWAALVERELVSVDHSYAMVRARDLADTIEGLRR